MPAFASEPLVVQEMRSFHYLSGAEFARASGSLPGEDRTRHPRPARILHRAFRGAARRADEVTLPPSPW